MHLANRLASLLPFLFLFSAYAHARQQRYGYMTASQAQRDRGYPGSIYSISSVDEVRELLHSGHSAVVVVLHSRGCRPCKGMLETSIPAYFREFPGHLGSVALAECEATLAWRKEFGVTGTPTTIAFKMGREGNLVVVGAQVGAMGHGVLREFIDRVR